MSAVRPSVRPSRKPTPRDYILALAAATCAVFGHWLLSMLVPGIAAFTLLLPAIVMAGILWGTAPAILAAAAGGLALVVMTHPLMSEPRVTPTRINAVIFILACIAILFATDALRRALAAASAAEARLAEIFRQIPGAAAIIEAPDGRLLLRSASSDAILGEREAPMAGGAVLGRHGGIDEGGRPLAAEAYPIIRALKQGDVIRAEKLRYLKPDGSRADLEVYAGPVRDAEGRIVAAIATAFDVTDRIAAERRLRESEIAHRHQAERLAVAIEVGGLGLWAIDVATGIVHIDAPFARMLDLPAQTAELPVADIESLVAPEHLAFARAVFAGAVMAVGAYVNELAMRTSQGRPRIFVIRGVAIAEEGKVIGVLRDVTDRRQREDSLREALEARQVLMLEADHRIKNSLQLVAALLRLQRDRTTSEEARAPLAAALARVEAVSEAHRALQHSPDLKRVEFDPILRDLCARVATLSPEITMQCDVATALWLDAEQAIPLGLIVSELLTNAQRHAYAPGIAGEIRVTAGVYGDSLVITVTDAGAGLPKKSSRTGLGSTVITALIRQLRATLATRSAPNQGTTIRIELILERDDRRAGLREA